MNPQAAIADFANDAFTGIKSLQADLRTAVRRAIEAEEENERLRAKVDQLEYDLNEAGRELDLAAARLENADVARFLGR